MPRSGFGVGKCGRGRSVEMAERGIYDGCDTFSVKGGC